MLTDITYPGEVMTGRVVELHRKLAILSLRNRAVPLFRGQMEWMPIRKPSELFSLGDRVDVMAVNSAMLRRLDANYWRRDNDPPGELWLSRLPFVSTPAASFCDAYAEGDVVEVEFVEYVNWYIARCILPTGLMVELRTNDIHPRSTRELQWRRKLFRGERIEIVFRSASMFGSWVERYFERSTSHACASVGYRGDRISRERKSTVEAEFISARETAQAERMREAYRPATE